MLVPFNFDHYSFVIYFCYNLDVECPPNAHVLKVVVQSVVLLGGIGNIKGPLHGPRSL
jgi:hypothetical protein